MVLLFEMLYTKHMGKKLPAGPFRKTQKTSIMDLLRLARGPWDNKSTDCAFFACSRQNHLRQDWKIISICCCFLHSAGPQRPKNWRQAKMPLHFFRQNVFLLKNTQNKNERKKERAEERKKKIHK